MNLNEIVTKKPRFAPPRILLHGEHGLGKALEETQPVLTPKGWVEIGRIKIGDEVCCPNGQLTKVTGVFRQGLKDCYHVEMTHGSVVACKDHLWSVFTYDKGGIQETLTTEQLIANLNNLNRKNYKLPAIASQDFTTKLLPIPPYLLGAWLGDGTKHGSNITNPDKEVQGRCIKDAVKIGIEAIVIKGQKCDIINIANRNSGGRKPNPFIALLKENHLFECNSKEIFIPKEYLFASKKQRMSLLNGLLDTDGYVGKDGTIQYYSISEQLVCDVDFLVRSFGGLTKKTSKIGKYKNKGKVIECKRCYTLTISVPDNIIGSLFTIIRKKNRKRKKTQERYYTQYIKSITPVEKKECVCITVEDRNKLFITSDFIPTHNSSWAAVSPSPIFLQCEDGLGEIDVDRFPLAGTVDQLFQHIGMLIKEDHQFKTVVLDTLDWFETLVWKQICEDKQVKNIEDIGYAKGYSFAMNYHERLLSGLSKLRKEKNMAIILLAHNEVKSFNNPEGEDYSKFVIKLHKKAAKKYEEYCDAVLFINNKAYVTKKDGALKAKVIGSGERSIFTQPRPTFAAKSRYDVPFEIPFRKGDGFTDFLKLIKKG